MRKKVLGTIAGLLASAGGALAQLPASTPANFAPRPVAPTGAFGGDIQKTQGFIRPPDGIPPVLPGGGPEGMPGMGGPGMGMPGMGGPGMGGPGMGMPGMGGPGMGMPGMGGPGMGMPGMGGPGMEGGMPGYPPQGPYGQQNYSTPRLEGPALGGAGLFSNARSSPRYWVNSEYLLMFPRSQPLNQPLIITSAPAAAATLGPASTSVLYGAGDLSYGAASGFRISGGFFRPQDQRLGLELSALYIAPTSNDFFGRSGDNGVPTFGRPFFATDLNTPSSILASFPTVVSGSILGRSTSRLWGIDANGLLNLYRTPPENLRAWTLNLVGGFKFLDLGERLNITSASTVLAGRTVPYAGITVPENTTLIVEDDFQATNRFYGGQAGFQSQYYGGRWYFGLTGKVGLGIMHQELSIDGTTGQNNPTVPIISQTIGGVYANPQNIGTYTNDAFGIITDLNATLGFNVTSWLTVTAGYNLIHMNSVVRPGNQIDGRIDSTVIPTSINYGAAAGPRNNFRLRTTDYFIHGMNFGFNVHY